MGARVLIGPLAKCLIPLAHVSYSPQFRFKLRTRHRQESWRLVRVAGHFQSMFDDYEAQAHLLFRFEMEGFHWDRQFQNGPPTNRAIGTDFLPVVCLTLLEEREGLWP